MGFGNIFNRQPAWFIDGTNSSGLASNSNSGADATHPLLNDEPRWRRWGRRPLLTSAVAVTYMSAPSDPIVYEEVGIGTSGSLTVSGTPATVATGTLGTVRSFNRATQAPWGVDGSLAAHVGRRLTMTTGTAGAAMWIVKDEGAGEVRLTTPGTVNIPGGDAFTRVTPSGNFKIETLANITVGAMSFRCATNAPGAFAVQFQDLGLDFHAQAAMRSEMTAFNTTFARCSLTKPVYTMGKYLVSNCLNQAASNGSQWMAGSFGLVFGGGGISCSTYAQLGSNITLDFDFLVQSDKILAGSEFLTIGTACVFDRGTAGMQILSSGHVNCATQFDSTHQLWGSSNPQYGISIDAGGSLTYVGNIPSVNSGLGAGREVLLGGVDSLYANLSGDAMMTNGAFFGIGPT